MGRGQRSIIIATSKRSPIFSRVTVYYGENLEKRVLVRAGDQIYVPADVPHAPCNESGATCAWLVVHSSASDQDGIVLLPELDQILATKISPQIFAERAQ
jgi:uncharacterized RmlC-like cupin family protein